jgi:hypothetical protein
MQHTARLWLCVLPTVGPERSVLPGLGSAIGHRCEPERLTARTVPKKFRYRRWGNAKLDAGLFPHNNCGGSGWRRCTTGEVRQNLRLAWRLQLP